MFCFYFSPCIRFSISCLLVSSSYESIGDFSIPIVGHNNTHYNNVSFRSGSESDRLLQPLVNSNSPIAADRPDSISSGSLADRPLFGESSSRERLINTGLLISITILVFATLISIFFITFKFVNFLALCVTLSIAFSHALLVYWYKQGMSTKNHVPLR